jgi:hypothetical protein
MSKTTRQIISECEDITNRQNADFLYFVEKAYECLNNGDIEGAKKYLKRYTMCYQQYQGSPPEVDWDDLSLARKS